MNNIWKRSLSLLLALVMVMGMLPMGVLAAEQEEPVAVAEDIACIEEAEAAEICSVETETAEPEEELVFDSASAEASAAAATVDINPADADGLIWLNKDKENELMANVMNGGLRDMILIAVGKSVDGNEKVCYQGCDVSNPMSLMLAGVAYELADAITAQKTVLFTIDDEEVAIVCRNIKNAIIAVETVTISSGVALTDAEVEELVKAEGVTYKISHNGDDLTDLSKANVVYNNVSYSWPAKGSTKEYANAVTVTLRDSLDLTEKTGAGKVILEDATPKHTVTYMGANGAVVAQYSVVEGEKTPVPANPVRKYYNFAGWDTTIAATVTKDATYNAKWTAQLDLDGNGKADQEQEFTVTYYNEGSVYETLTAAWGSAVPKPAVNPTREDYTFVSWMPVGGSASSVVTNNISYTAYWVEESDGETGGETGGTEPVAAFSVKYVLGEGVEPFTLKTKDGMAQDVPYTPDDAANDFVVWLGWHTKAGAEYVEYDFSKEVTDDSLVLYARWADDGNNNEKADGTAEDPYTTYVYMFNEDTVMYSETVWGTDDGFDPESMIYPESTKDEVKFDGWDEKETTGGGYDKTITYAPIFKDDTNHNDVFDNSEIVGLAIEKPEGIENPGKVEVNVVDVVNGEFVTSKQTVGELKVDGENVGTAFLRNSSKNGEATVVTVTPVKGQTYVSEIYLEADNQVMSLSLTEEASMVAAAAEATYAATGVSVDYAEDYSYVTYTLPADGTTTQYTLTVVFGNAAELKLKPTQDPLYCGVQYNGETVYNAVVDSPKYDKNAKINVEYQARAAMTGDDRLEVNVQELYDTLMAYGDTGKTAWNYLSDYVFHFEKINGEYYYTRELSAVWLDLDEDVLPTSVTDPQIIADNYIAVLKNTPYDQLMDKVTNIYQEKIDLDAMLDASMIEPFGYNPNNAGKVTEFLNITYDDGKQCVSSENIEIELLDTRKAGSIKVPATGIEFVYNTYKNDDAILKKLTLNGGNTPVSQIVLSDTCFDKNVGTYTITATFNGNTKYKPCTATFELRVTKAAVKLSLEKIVNIDPCDKSSDEYKVYAEKASAKTNPAGVSVVSVIAGLDMAEINVNLEKPQLTEGKVKAWAWIKLPEDMAAMLEDKYDLTKTFTLDDITTMLESHRNELAAIKVSGHAVDAILDQLSEYVKFVGVDVAITFKAQNEFPTSAGSYLNFAVTVDGNYETKVAGGLILVNPFAALPNRGGVQLVYKNTSDAQNLFTFANDGKAKELKMTYNGKYVDTSRAGVDAHIYYYGIDSSAKLYYDGEIPSKPGVYVVAGIYTEQDTNGNLVAMGSDAVLMIIGMTEATIEVKREVKTYNGKAQTPTIEIKNKETGMIVNDAAKTIISGTVDVDASGKITPASLTGIVNIDFPAGVKDLWDQYVTFEKLPAECTITMKTIKNFVEWCINKVEVPADKMIQMGAPEKYVEKAEYYAKAGFSKVLEVLNKIPTEKLPGLEVNLSFTGKVTGFTNTGVYLYYGIITDPDYLPDANAGLMVITAHKNDLVMYDTHVPYNGEGQAPVTHNNTGRDGLTVVLTRDEKTNAINSVSFHMDDDMTQIVKDYIEAKTGKKIVDNKTTVGALRNAGQNWVNELTDKIVNKIEAVAKKKLGVSVDLSNELAAVRTRVYNKLDQINKLSDNVVIAVDNALPVNVGEYEFFTFSYGLVYAHAMLYIEPIHVEITPANLEKVYGEVDPDLNEGAVVRYYGYYGVGGEELTKQYDDDLAPGAVEYTITREDGEDVGEYNMIVTGTITDTTGNFVKEIEKNGGIFTINPKVIEVEIPNLSKYYDGKDNDIEDIVVDGVNGEKITIKLSYEGSSVDDHEITVAWDNKNYDIKAIYENGAEYATMTIKQAEIIVIAKSMTVAVDAVDYELTWSLDEENSKGKVDEGWLEENIELQANATIENGWLVPGEYEITGTAPEMTNWKVTVVPGVLTVNTDGFICWNVQDKIYFKDLSDALDAADAGETVQMLAAATTEEWLKVKAGTTLDLNGSYVTAGNFLSFGQVEDTAAEVGGVVITSNTAAAFAILQDNNVYMPLYDVACGCYRFFEYSVEYYTTQADANSVKFAYTIKFANVDAYELLKNYGSETMLNVNHYLHWDNLQDSVAEYEYSSDLIKKFGSSSFVAIEMGKNAVFTFTVNGLSAITGQTLTAYIHAFSETNPASSADAPAYPVA